MPNGIVNFAEIPWMKPTKLLPEILLDGNSVGAANSLYLNKAQRRDKLVPIARINGAEHIMRREHN